MVAQEENFNQIQEWLVDFSKTEDAKVKKQLQDLIVVAAMPFVKRIACGLARRSTDPIDDLIQVGSIGLIKAINLFNPNVGTKFKTYATYLITGEIRHYLRDKASMIKAPREIQELAYRINCVIKKFSEKGIDATSELIAEEMALPIEKVNNIIEIDRRKSTISLDQTMSYEDDDATSLADKIPSGDYQEFLTSYEEKIMLTKAISKLKPKLKEVIELNYYEDLNQRQIAERLNISQMQVSRRLKQALSDMYDIITKTKED
ncbi:MAG: sigma-70 family RNA polymerase sigma factor [bacterium]|nr:sigma-70 family RNA polymerase sigma factor [bacterium]